MRSSVTRGGWILPVLASAVLSAGCQSASASAHYPGAIDACRLPGPNAQAQLAPGTVEIPPDSVKTAEAPYAAMLHYVHNTHFEIDGDHATGIGGVYLTQVLPFADKKSLPLYYEFEKAFYA